MSFVQRPEDVAETQALIGRRSQLLSELEKPASLDRLDEIIALSDMVMVARGDLGVEMPPDDVPVLQRRIVRACRRVGKPVVVATQMLESMIKSPAPTRAEASDVANAIYDGADAVMLSAETAAGDWPVEAAQMMDRIARRVQADPGFLQGLQSGARSSEETDSDAITAAARQTAETSRPPRSSPSPCGARRRYAPRASGPACRSSGSTTEASGGRRVWPWSGAFIPSWSRNSAGSPS